MKPAGVKKMTEIRVNYRRVQSLGRDRLCFDFEWVGDKTQPVVLEMDRHHYRESGVRREGNRILGLPWPLRVVSEMPLFYSDGILCVRTDRNPVSLWLWLAQYHTRRKAQWLGVRLMWTAHIWGLARIPECEAVSWHHLHLVRWLEKAVTRLKTRPDGRIKCPDGAKAKST